MLKTIRKGDMGTEVRVLRGLLGLTDGSTFDAATDTAVRNFQEANGLAVDGIAGANTWTALSKAAKTCKNGSSGAHTRALQTLLSGIAVDGIFGTKTRAQVVAYQSAAGLATDGIAGPKTWGALIGAATSASSTSDSSAATVGTAKFVQPKDFKQGGSPWGSKMYSSTGNKSQTYANSGCGPTAAANVVYTAKDKTITPETLGKLAVANGYRTANNGTAWAFFKYLAGKYGFSKFVQTTSLATLKAALDAGAFAVASMGPGYWTNGGHFINPWKYDDTNIYANDPASSSRKKQTLSAFNAQRKQYFIFYP